MRQQNVLKVLLKLQIGHRSGKKINVWMMEMFHNKQHLIQWLQDNLTDHVLQSLIQHGELELLGGFDPLPGSSNPGWIVALTSYRTGKTYYICIGIDKDTGQPRWWRTEKVKWQNWDGDKSKNSLYCGDVPNKYRQLKRIPR